MGICLDTEQSDGSQEFEEGLETWARNSPRGANVTTPSAGKFPHSNGTNIHFDPPKVPVIFILGGPGSGKVTHCDNLMQEKKGVTHINMTDLLQQYAMGNDVPDFGQLSSKTVTEVLMLEMKMSPDAKTYLVSGYPRNMRDVVEYSEKIQMVQGVILISWRQKVLEKQIEYGAKLGQVVLSLARMELNNFYKNVVPVAEYFDQSNMLISINGERAPADVYMDFRRAVFRILGSQDNPPVFRDGRVAPVPDDVTTELPTVPAQPPSQVSTEPARSERLVISPHRPQTQIISVNPNPPNFNSPTKATYPPVLWVIGGPGSNKAALCAAAAAEVGWHHVSLGKILRAAAEPPDPRYNREVAKLKEYISNGEMVPMDVVMRHVESQMADNIGRKGIILDGFPRDMAQVSEFETKFKQKPTIILLDCSKLQLGRGRLDDSVTAFRRRLEIFRKSSLPMLKAMDNIGRLTIVDGDTDSDPVQEDFKNVVREHIDYMQSQEENESTSIENGHIPNGNAIRNGSATPNGNALPNSGAIPNGIAITDGYYKPNGKPVQNGYANVHANGRVSNGDTELQDLEDEPIETISRTVGNGNAHDMTNGAAHAVAVGAKSMANGFVNSIANVHVKGMTNGHVNGMSNGNPRAKQIANGFVDRTQPMYNEVNYMDGHI